MNQFEFIVTLNDEKQYTYGFEVVKDIDLFNSKQMVSFTPIWQNVSMKTPQMI